MPILTRGVPTRPDRVNETGAGCRRPWAKPVQPARLLAQIRPAAARRFTRYAVACRFRGLAAGRSATDWCSTGTGSSAIGNRFSPYRSCSSSAADLDHFIASCHPRPQCCRAPIDRHGGQPPITSAFSAERAAVRPVRGGGYWRHRALQTAQEQALVLVAAAAQGITLLTLRGAGCRSRRALKACSGAVAHHAPASTGTLSQLAQAWPLGQRRLSLLPLASRTIASGRPVAASGGLHFFVSLNDQAALVIAYRTADKTNWKSSGHYFFQRAW